jgi:exopolysaccharide production protein ExoY
MTMSIHDFPTGDAVTAPIGTTLQSAPRHGVYRKGAKRIFDCCAVILAAPIVAPLIGIMAAIVAAEGGQPFYTQDRVGLGGRTFRIWKLRSMVRDADARMEAHLASDPAARAEWDMTQKLKNDPRITRLGRILRRSSLDELPQLWNVLKGDMSLVGPRPMMPSQKQLYPGQAYYALRPGITGLWQTAGRNCTTFAARADFDASYEAAVTMRGDLGLLWRTVAVVLRGTGY